MIFYLTDSLRPKENDTEEYRKMLRHSIRNLAVSAIENSHGVLGDMDILNDCVELFSGDDELSAFFQYLVGNWYSMPVPECITYYIEVVRDAPQEKIVEGRKISQRVISDFCNQLATHPCLLVCEDDTDCEFYRFMVKNYMEQHNCRAHVRYANDGTGGCVHAYDKILNHINSKQVCLCILDSDKCYPEKDINKEVMPCLRLDNQLCGYKCVVLEVHEIENLLPLNYIIPAVRRSEDYAKYSLCRDQLRHFMHIVRSPKAADILPFYDFKDGVKNQKEIRDNADHMRFAEKCWTEDTELNDGVSFQVYLANLKKDKCICFRLSRTVLEDTLSYIKSQIQNGTLKAPVLQPFQAQEWNRVGQSLLNWGYSSALEAVS